ncbi:filamentous hemagglutinin family N-terminal domain-containing protein [Pseudomonas asplenii]|uniref:Filamentous hemagglutinin family N-terminal domain-containing protein n=1 Tax=Pseudomonas asplenii TaxID=53407 RepID=A0A1H1XUL8_9PSED|nr:filamentous hemagglutinin family protein [Pseudomonas asplenii]SDT12915.1 filamentous hemagglutinin family N-terminal domain-containing protein [Pseudomonas asplenii]
MLRCKPSARLNARRHDDASSILRLKPLAHAIALLMVTGSAQAETAFSSAWFTNKGANLSATAARNNSGQIPGIPTLSEQSRANQQLQRSLSNLNNTVAAIAAQQAAQAAGRQAALGQLSNIPDGLGKGGLQVDNSLTQGWLNAKAPTQTQTAGKTTVSIEQTADKAILNWETFNVGRNTTVDFQQQSNWAVLNRVNDPLARPSEIQGQVKGNGTVMIMNRNGVVFSGSSQVNVRNLVAAAATITDDQFTQRGIYVDTNGTQPTFTDAAGKVEVQRGAIIQTLAPTSSTESGGYALLLGAEVENAGTIVTAKGQTTLAAGDSFYIRRGVGTSGNPRSTTRGNEVATSLKTGSTAGKVSNSGLIMASTGDITLTGHQVQQNGVALASTSVDTRGTLHLLNAATDTSGSVTLGQGSSTAILLENTDATALDSQRNNGLSGLDGLPNTMISGFFNNLSTVSDRTDQSRIEIVSGGNVDFQNGSITLATGGQVAVSAAQRSLVRDGAVIDVSGAVGVKVSMESNNIKINVQGNEQRDAPVNRDGGKLINNDVWVDLRELVFVPAGTNGYATDRWYTAGGLLEVGGYLGTQGHTVGEWMAQGGTLTFTGKDVVTQQGAQFNLSGGTVDVQSGYIQQTWLTGPDGRLYELSRAPGDILYSGIYKGFESSSARWGQTEYFYNPMIAQQQRYESGYTVGRDAGKLVIGTTNAVLEGQIVNEVFKGDRQNQAPNLNLDGYQQSRNAVAQRAQLIFGKYTPIYDKKTGTLRYSLDAVADQVQIGEDVEQIAAGLDLGTALPANRQGTMYLDSDQLNGFQLGAIKVAAKQQIQVNGDLSVGNGGDITLYGPQVRVNANLSAHSGSLHLGNVLNQVDSSNPTQGVIGQITQPPSGQKAVVDISSGVKLDTSGLWSNLALDGDNSRLPYISGGSVSVLSSGDVNLRAGALVDVSSGAAILNNRKLSGGKGGDVTLSANLGNSTAVGELTLDGELRGYGVNGGGTLKLQAGKVQIGDSSTPAAAGTLQLAGDFFNKGFSAYDITANQGLMVTEGTQVDVTLPVYRVDGQAGGTPSGVSPSTLLERWTPDLYQNDAAKGVLTQRSGASLSLNAGTNTSSAADMASTVLSVGRGAVINVDPGQAIVLNSIGQLTLDGTLNAWGGKVSLGAITTGNSDQVNAIGHGRSIWVGEHALIDVAARAVTATDARGRVYGQVRDGGSISLGGTFDPSTGKAQAADLFLVVREGARLEASGTQAMLDVSGQGRTRVASNGGSITLASNNGLYLDGSFNARSGGEGAAGGTLSVVLQSQEYLKAFATNKVLNYRELVLSQNHQANVLPASAEDAAGMLTYGQGRFGVDQFEAGGFDNLTLFSNGVLSVDGDVTLSARQSLQLYSSYLGLTSNAADQARVRLSSAYLLLGGMLGSLGKESYVVPSLVGTSVAPLGHGVFSADANLIDVRGNVIFGLKSAVSYPGLPSVALERRGFDRVELTSAGDLRFLAGASGTDLASGSNTGLSTAGDMTLRAAQLYPATQVSASIMAGVKGTGTSGMIFDPSRTLTIARVGDAEASIPYSAFGRLQLGAAVIKQGGVVRAPLGLIEIGTMGDSTQGGVNSVELLPGSITSVSGKGLVLPYGGTFDGQTYYYNGKAVEFLGQGGVPTANRGLQVGVALGGQSVSVLPDATLDLSGGGDLLGAGFISGRGGSTDARFNPLVQFGADGSFLLPGLATNPIYAIVPGAQSGYAPVSPEGGAVDPMMGQQITIGAGVSGLPAGTYTLMPSTYALLPGAFRVELNGLASGGTSGGTQLLRNGSWATSGQLSIANTGIRNSVASQIILTSGDVLRRYSQYNETSYAQFAIADAARLGVPRALLPMDARTLKLELEKGAGEKAFTFEGIGKFDAAEGGYAGTVAVLGRNGSALEIVGAGRQATAQFDGVTLDAQSLNALGAGRMVIGGLPTVTYGQGGNYITLSKLSSSIAMRDGASLGAPEVFLVSGSGDILLEQGASINTLGYGNAAYDARNGFIYQVGNMLAVSNGLLNVVNLPEGQTAVTGGIQVGTCVLVSCTGQTSLYSNGSIAAVTPTAFQLDDKVRYGTRHLTLALNTINVGTPEALADAVAGNRLPAGLTLNQQLIDRLLQGDTQSGAPALETLQLSARDAFNFYGTTTLDTYDAQTGKSRLSNLMLSTPAIYGAGVAGDVASIHTANLIWLGSDKPAGSVIAGGAGTGSGRLDINAERIEFGYGAFAQPNTVKSFDRLVLGFADVNLSASERITANHKGSLSVYQSQGAYEAGKGFQYSGGNLNILTPLMTGEAGSVNRITAGGAIDVSSSGAAVGDVSGQGAELALQGSSIRLASAVVLPSGKVSLGATGDVVLTDDALIDVAGRAIAFNDVTKYGPGGSVKLESRNGNIHLAAGSRLDLSAKYNQAGTLSAVALDASAGLVDLQGRILGASSGYYDAGGTLMPYTAGGVEIQAQRLGTTGTLDEQFAVLNQRLNDGQVSGSRSFQLKQGDLTIGDGLKAGDVTVSIDNGSLRVSGTVDASGERVGSIRLSAKNGLTLDGTAVLDAHGTRLRVDSYGKIIDSPNRAIVELNSGSGQLTLGSGARIDLRHGTEVALGNLPGQNDGRARGTLELNAPRLGGVTGGDIAIDASGPLTIQGARSIAVNGTWRYDDAAYGTDPAASGRPYQIIDQAYLDAKHLQSTAFINAALANTSLMQGKLAGLNNTTYADAFHLRPGVEIVSATPDGDLVVQGDIDLSGYRYASVNPNTRKTGVYGSGEVGSLTFRAGGDLNIYGSINDGFAPPPATQDDKGWTLLPGIDINGGDTIVPGAGVTLADGTTFPGGVTLNYDLPIKGLQLAPGTRLPVSATLDQALSLPAGTVLAAAVRDASGNLLFAAGTLLSQSQTLVAGTQLDAGSILPMAANFKALTWPKGVPLPGVAGTTQTVVLNGDQVLSRGALIPSGTEVKLLAGVESIQLRPEVSGRQGQIWAVAPMLAEGSQSWSLRLVAGADTEAADSRIVQPHPVNGDLHLADTHYGMFGKAKAGGYIWTEEGSLNWAGDTSLVGQPIDFDAIGYPGLCTDNPTFCKAATSYVWTEEGSLNWAGDTSLVGQPIDFDALGYPELCTDNPTFCKSIGQSELVAGSQRFSVIRTGTADLELLAGGSLKMDSLYGVYTAGNSSTATSASDPYNQARARGTGGTVLGDAFGGYEDLVNSSATSVYRAWYPDSGGNLTLKVGGDLTGNIMDRVLTGLGRPNSADLGYDTANIGNWLWRQGSGSVNTGGQAQPTAWWINFGTYTNTAALGGSGADQMVGFTGFGTLGGGDVDVQVAGDAGLLASMSGAAFATSINPRSQGLVLAVGSTGRVAGDGSVQMTGGGDLNLRVGGALNPASTITQGQQNGLLVDLRGHVQLNGASMGSVALHYGNQATDQAPGEVRAYDPTVATRALSAGGMTLVPGDATFNLSTLGDLVVQNVLDPGRVSLMNATPFVSGGVNGAGQSWFTLWTGHTAIDLFSAGGDLTPYTLGTATDAAVVYPSILRAVAASGSLYYGKAATSQLRDPEYKAPLLLAPSATGELQFLAGDSIYASGFSVSRSGAAAETMATPWRPAFAGLINGSMVTNGNNLSTDGNTAQAPAVLPLFTFGAETASDTMAANSLPSRFYALNGDLLGVTSGRIISFQGTGTPRFGQTWYEGAGPVWMMAGRDIVSSGTALGSSESGATDINKYTSTGNLFVHNNPNDVSIVSAGRDILYSNFTVAGPGTLELTAGRNILMEDKASITSIGAVVPGDSRPGASIVMQAGFGANGADYLRFIQTYLNPDNLAQAGQSLSGGKVAKTYEAELVAWLAERYGFSGTAQQARAYYAALSPEQQRIFARDVYFAELKAAGREYNQAGGPRQGSYIRGREAIALLFPQTDVAGNPITYQGDITLFGGAGVHTDFGGNIQMLTPGGGQVFGIEGVAPPSTAGVITQGAGDIQLYSLDSILLGQSRIMTTFGGSIMAWSAAGDINAGRGSKTTVVYTPPKRVYDNWGNVTLSPSVPSTGAGIATLNPIPEIAPGDIDLIAPLGTIDAGEAGIRVSGNVNIAALQVVNAANIQTQGKSSGVPMTASINTGAMTSASSAGAAASQAAEDAARQQQQASKQDRPSIFTVEVLGFGSEPVAPSRDSASHTPAYNPDSPVQVLGAGPLSEQAKLRLTDEERGNLTL